MKTNKPIPLLIKYATRERSNRMLSVIKSVFDNVVNMDNITMVLSLDKDDVNNMSKDVLTELKDLMAKYPIRCFIAERTTKVGALNRDLDKVEWEKVLFISDYTEICKKGFDEVILSEGKDWKVKTYESRNTNGLRKHNIYVFSKTMYENGYIFNPNLKSNFVYDELWLREFEANDDNRDSIIPLVHHYYNATHWSIHRYIHPKWGYFKPDSLLLDNQKTWANDLKIIESLKSQTK